MLDAAGEGKFFCLAGVGGHISGMVAPVEGYDKVPVLDGCPVTCAKKVMDAANINDYEYLVVTDLGIERVHDFRLSEEHLDQVISACRSAMNGSKIKENTNEAKLVETTGSSGSGNSGGCCSCG